MNLRTMTFLCAVFGIMLYVGCDNPAIQQPSTEEAVTEAPVTDPLIYVVEAMGFCREQILDTGDAFEVDGDIVFPKAHLLEDMGGGLAKTTQYATTNAVSWSKSGDILIKMHESLEGEPWGIDYWQMLQDAVGEWNSVSSTKLHFTPLGPGQELLATATNYIIVYSDTAEIPKSEAPCGNFNNLDEEPNNFVLGKAAFPRSDGNPGRVISLNVSLGPTFFYANLLGSLVHEIGHTIGFRHTNWASVGEGFNQGCAAGAFQIGRLTTDNNSAMNANNLGGDLSSNDEKATRILYPSSLSSPSFNAISFVVINENPTVASVSVTYKSDEKTHRVEVWRSATNGPWQKASEGLPSIDDQTPYTHTFSENYTGQVRYKLHSRNYKGDFTSSYSGIKTITIPFTGNGGLP